jgi:hypothetical protein
MDTGRRGHPANGDREEAKSGEAPLAAVVVTDAASVNADCDNGAAIHDSARRRRRVGAADYRLDSFYPAVLMKCGPSTVKIDVGRYIIAMTLNKLARPLLDIYDKAVSTVEVRHQRIRM